MRELKKLDRSVWLAVMVAALGYFVDIYDLLLFSIVRVASLQSLGVEGDALKTAGVTLINSQMAGVLVGGILWGILGDKRGRLSVLFGSIFLYSSANIGNAFVQTVEQYAILRFIAGIGLAGELGAGITLVAEVLPARLRGYGTSIVAAIGILGAVFGGLVGDLFDWRTTYIIGGVMGFAVLLLRVGVRESGMFHKTKDSNVRRGDFMLLFRRRPLFVKYLAVILIGVPIWYVIGILWTFTPEFGRAFGMTEIPTAGKAVMFGYLGLAIGDFASGMLSQRLQSRKLVIMIYVLGTALTAVLHILFARESVAIYYAFCAVTGFFAGYWAMFITVAAEQFGTNIRSTVTTTVPNFVRGAVIPITIGFEALSHSMMGIIESAVVVGVVVFALAVFSVRFLEETFHKDLDYHEIS